MPILTRAIPAPAAGTGSSSFRIFNEMPVGAINGVNTVYMAAFYFEPGTEGVYHNGVRQMEGALCDYVRSESGGVGTGFDTIVFAVPLRVGDNLLIEYDPS
jgi:hypothetical protein